MHTPIGVKPVAGSKEWQDQKSGGKRGKNGLLLTFQMVINIFI